MGSNSHFLSQQSIIVLAMTTFPLSSYGDSSITERHLKAQGRERERKKEEKDTNNLFIVRVSMSFRKLIKIICMEGLKADL